MKNILSIKNVSYSYHTQEGETPALTDISFDVSSEASHVLSVRPDAANLHFFP